MRRMGSGREVGKLAFPQFVNETDGTRITRVQRISFGGLNVTRSEGLLFSVSSLCLKISVPANPCVWKRSEAEGIRSPSTS